MEVEKDAVYLLVYELALIIPVVSIFGVVFASWLQRRERKRFQAQGYNRQEVDKLLGIHSEPPAINLWILGGGSVGGAVSVFRAAARKVGAGETAGETAMSCGMPAAEACISPSALDGCFRAPFLN